MATSGKSENVLRKGIVVDNSDRAIKFHDLELQLDYWLPRSQAEVYQQDGFDWVSMPPWLWRKKQEELGNG